MNKKVSAVVGSKLKGQFTIDEVLEFDFRSRYNALRLKFKMCPAFANFLYKMGSDLESRETLWGKGVRNIFFTGVSWILEVNTELIPTHLFTEELGLIPFGDPIASFTRLPVYGGTPNYFVALTTRDGVRFAPTLLISDILWTLVGQNSLFWTPH